MRIETELDGKTVGAIERHYLHAKEKHPYFCDALLPHTLPRSCVNYLSIEDERRTVKEELQWMRGNNADDARKGETIWNNIVNEEVWEATEAMVEGDTAAAVEECYDAISVLLRVVDVLEGRQKLGNPKSQTNKKESENGK